MLDAKCFQFVFLAIAVGQILAQGAVDLCQGKGQELAACSRRLHSTLASNPDGPTMCSATATYIQCHQGVAISCHNNPLIENPGFVQATSLVFSQFDNQCPQNAADVLCDHENLFGRFVPICNQLIIDVTPSTSEEAVCRTLLGYLDCMETANGPCSGRDHNLDQMITMARTEAQRRGCSQTSPNEVAEGEGADNVQTDVDVMVGDQPAPAVLVLTTDTPPTAAPDTTTEAPETTTEAPDCSVAGRAIQIRKCHRHIMELVGDSPPTNKLRCRYSRRYLRCTLRLMQQCPESRQHQAVIYDPFHDDMVNACEANSFRCPFHVIEGELTIVDYCELKTEVNNYAVESPEFCSHVAAMPRCLIRTKNKCKNRGFRRRHINDALASINTTVTSHCINDIEARSAMSNLESLDIQERGDPLGIFIDYLDDEE